MITLTRQAARQVQAMTGRGTFIFNDRLADGRRSLKVWQWGHDEYLKAKELLEQAGCEVEIVTFNRRYTLRRQTRLHVRE